MIPLAGLAWVALALADPPAAMPPPSAFAALGDDAAEELVILGETRPILIRLRVMIGDRAFRSAWADSTQALHAQLDRDGDSRLTVAEAEAGGLTAFAAPAGPAPANRPRVEVDVAPKDGIISVAELSAALRGSSGPLRIQVDGASDRRTDDLFDHLDRDKDGQLGRAELTAVVGSLRRLDRDDNELISLGEVAAVEIPAAASSAMGRPGRDVAAPPVVGLDAGESPVRLVRLLFKKYDVAGSGRGPGKPDSRLSPDEFAIPTKAFAAADVNRDGSLNAEEVRGYLAGAPRDAIVDVALSAAASGHPSIRIAGGDGGKPEGLEIRQIAEGVVEIDAGPIRLDLHVDDGMGAIDSTRRMLRDRFDAADANRDGYLEESELIQDDGQPSALSGVFRPMDRDGDGKLYPAELDESVTRQAATARGRLLLTASNEGRALFGMLDLDRDRQLGAREIFNAFARVSACDRDRDGRVSPGEIPHHIQITLARGDLSAILAPAAAPSSAAVATSRSPDAPRPVRPAAGPDWFRKMDRNRDGDVSRREFLGSHPQFDRLDRDHDGLLGPDEAEAARPVKGPGG